MAHYYKYGHVILIDKFTFGKVSGLMNLFRKIPLAAHGLMKTYKKASIFTHGDQWRIAT